MKLTPVDLKNALNYSYEFVSYLQNLRDEQVALKVVLRYSPAEDLLTFVQSEATLHAKISLLDELLSANMNPETNPTEI